MNNHLSYLLKLNLSDVLRKIDSVFIFLWFNTFMLRRRVIVYPFPKLELVIIIDLKHNRKKDYNYSNNLKSIDVMIEI